MKVTKMTSQDNTEIGNEKQGQPPLEEGLWEGWGEGESGARWKIHRRTVTDLACKSFHRWSREWGEIKDFA